jgi:Leucine-rich repeat (LRR) protein
MDREGRVGEEEVSKVLSVFAHRKRMKFSFKKLPLEKILDVYSHVSALQLVSKEAFDISGLASLKNLEGLSLSGEVKGASVLNDLNLGVLSLTRVTFEQNALPSLPHCLKGLSIEDCKFADVTQLRRAHKLKVCKLSNFDAGIGGLAALPIEHMALKFVALSEKCELPSDLRTLSLVHLLAGSVLSPLAKLKLLEELEVSYCFNLTDASPLGSLASLRQLALGGPQFPLSSVGFGGLQRLRDMELSTFPEERSEELGSLSECAALTHLFLPNSELVKNGKELLEGLKISEGALPSSRLKEALMPLVSLEPDRI